MLPEAHFATVYAKPAGRPTVDSYITEVSQDTWILFPWDQEAVMAKTIVELKGSSDAKPVVRQRRQGGDRPARRQGHRRRPGAARLHDAAAGRRAQAGAAWRRQHVGEDTGGRHHRPAGRGAVREGQRLGHGHHRGARPARGAPGAAARAGRPAGALRRGHGERPALQSARRQVAQPVGRDAAARLPAAQVHRPHAFQRRAVAHRPARRRGTGARRVRQARGAGALHHAGLRARQESQRGRRAPIPTSKG